MKKLILAAFSFIMLGMANVNAQTLNESFENAFPPNDWTFYNYDYLSSQWGPNSSSPIAGSKVARLTGSSSSSVSHDDWMIPPKLSITSTTDSLHFFARRNGSLAPTHSIDVKISTTGKDTASFDILLETVTPSDWLRYSIDLGAYNGQDVYVALHTTSSGSSNLYIDSVTGPTLFVPSCPTIAYINTSNITHNSVELTWDSIANADSYTYEIFEDGMGPAGTPLVSGSTTDTNIVVNGLPLATDLEVWITTDCGATDGLSEIDGPITFSTICGPYDSEYIEEFTDYTFSNLPDCWIESKGELALNTTFTSTLASEWQNDNFANVPGASQSAKINLFTTDQYEWLISPTFNLDSIPNSQLSFFVALTQFNNPSAPNNGNVGDEDKFHVVISTDDGLTWSDTNIVLTYDTNNIPSHTGDYVTIPLGDYSGKVKIGFYGESTINTPGIDNDFLIDDVKWSETPTCDIISQITLDSLDSYNAYVSWDTTTWATDFLVEYGTSGFALGTGDQFTVNGDLFTAINNLLANTEYEVYVAPICSSTDTGSFQLSLTFTTDCAPLTVYFTEDFTSFLPNDCWSESNGNLIDTTILTATWSDWAADGFLNNTTTGSARNTLWSWSFTNEWLITESIDLDSMPYAQIEFDAGITSTFGTASADMGEGDRVVILVSTDNGETWLEENSLYTFTENNQPSNTGDHFNIPVTTYSGVVKFAFYIESFVSSNTYNFYVDNFQVSEAPSCLPTIEYNVISVEDTTATISWGNINGVNDYIIQYGEQGFDIGTGTTVTVTTGTSVELTGLDPVTAYDVYVQAICSSTDTAEYLLYTSFETECAILSTTVLEEFTTSVAPECWLESEGELTASTTLTGTTSDWMADGYLNVGFTGSARMRVFGTDEYHWLITPSIDLGAQAKQIEFDAGQTTTSGTSSAAFASDDRLAVVVSLDDGVTWSEDNIILEFNQGQQLLNAGGHYTASLENFANAGNVRIGFYSQSEIANLQLNVYVDNFELKDLDTTAVDLGMVDILVPDTFCTGDIVPISAVVENTGFVPVPTYPLKVEIFGVSPYNNVHSYFTNIQVDDTDTTLIMNLNNLQPGNYTAVITVLANADVNAMNNKFTKEFFVSDYPTVFAGSDITICYGESYTLDASGANTYAWEGGYTNGQDVSPTTTTTYIVAGANESGCETFDTVVVDVEINAAPTIIYVNQLLLTDELYLNYYWQFDGTTVGTNSTYEVTENGIYTLIAETFSGCEVMQTYNVMGIGVDEVTNFDISVHPNPVSDNLFIETDKEMENIKVFDLNGRKVIDGGLSDNKALNVSGLEDGIYILYGTVNGQPFQTKFTKQ